MQINSAPTKDCAYCAETIKSAAIKCRYCLSDLTAPPQVGAPWPSEALALVRRRLLARHLFVDTLRSMDLWVGNHHGEGGHRHQFGPAARHAIDELADVTIATAVERALHDVVGRVVQTSLSDGDKPAAIARHLYEAGLLHLEDYRTRDSTHLQRIVATAILSGSPRLFHTVCVGTASVVMATARSWWPDSETWDPLTVRELVADLVDELYAWARDPSTMSIWTPHASPDRLVDLQPVTWVVAEAGCALEHVYWLALVPDEED